MIRGKQSCSGRSHRRSGRWLLALASALPTLASASPEGQPQTVTVKAKRPDTDDHYYNDMLDALTMFQPYHQAHPDAVLRFRIRQRKEMAGADMSQLVVFISDPEDGTRVPIDVAPDGSFVLPSLPELRNHDAVVRTSMPPGALSWNVQITRQGADPRNRVLGDLRMECKLDIYAADMHRKLKNPAYYAMKLAMTDLCRNNPTLHWDTYGDRPLFAVHLRAGKREKSLNERESLHDGIGVPALYPLQDWPYLLKDYTYWAPLGDSSWPDDTTIRIIYTEDKFETTGGSQ